ncbi:GNAT family N-acetyltransferase [Lottiidibacillus patelloidae]|uniref:GNAT family N-acetyltransferase n=1 Tax=Lottiidibacillus patelloidae TaxID=2670334 RepID=A0A263BS68_9BACI|nr:GNAT family protein [Lottiidibacillus patelloidae]OZM56418.1 GNAT family N-acetyltransferase [Lottiidibacillus patelloidae]
MKIRKLELKDKFGMLEWMIDPEINSYFRFDPNKISEEQIIDFITNADVNEKDKHFAIVDQNDEYLGTISLKNINYQDANAEYAISLRKKAMGNNIAKRATDKIIDIAFKELELHKVYLNVISSNTRAIRFYEKYGFKYEGEFAEHVIIRGKYENLKWYSIIKSCQNN